MPNALGYYLVSDEGITGRFEVTMHTTPSCMDDGELVWSKHTSKNFPSTDYDTLIALIKNEMEKWDKKNKNQMELLE